MFFNNKHNAGGSASLVGTGTSRASLGSNNVSNTGDLLNNRMAGNVSFTNREDIQSSGTLPPFKPKRKRNRKKNIALQNK
jgi:hypothetical protein